MVLPTSISKRILWRFVNKEINRSIHHYHVFSVITILFEEMLEQLKNGEIIKIDNFGTLELKQLPPRRYFNVVKQQIESSISHKILRFKLSNKLKKILINHLNLDILYEKK